MVKLFYGNEPYRLEFERNKIKAIAEEMAYKEFTTWDDSVVAATKSTTFFVSKNVFALRIEKLGANDSLLEYLKDPSSVTDLYIFADSVDKNTRVYKQLAKDKDSIMECMKLDDKMLQGFVLKILKRNNTVISNDAYDLFKRRIAYHDDPECNLFVVKNYVTQLCFLTDKIGVDEVCEVVPETSNEKSFVLTEHLLNKNGDLLFKSARNLIDDGENPISMLSLLLRTFRLAYKASLYPELGYKERNVKLGFTYGRFPNTKSSPENISKAMELLQTAVTKIKSGYPAERVFLTTLAEVYQLV